MTSKLYLYKIDKNFAKFKCLGDGNHFIDRTCCFVCRWSIRDILDLLPSEVKNIWDEIFLKKTPKIVYFIEDHKFYNYSFLFGDSIWVRKREKGTELPKSKVIPINFYK